MKITAALVGTVLLSWGVALSVLADSDSLRVPDMGYEEVGDICAELEEEYSDALEYIEERELEDSREHVGSMVYLSSKLSAFAPTRRHDEFKEQADILKKQCLELEEAVVGYDEGGAWDRVSEIRQTCHNCHDLY